MKRMTRSSTKRETIRGQIKKRKASYTQKGRRAEAKKREERVKKKVLVSANDNMQQSNISRADNKRA
jgi:hypothetical protein